MRYRRLYDLRTDHDLTQKQVAAILSCNHQIYGKYERGIREIPASMVVILAQYYKVSTDYIFGLTNNPHRVK